VGGGAGPICLCKGPVGRFKKGGKKRFLGKARVRTKETGGGGGEGFVCNENSSGAGLKGGQWKGGGGGTHTGVPKDGKNAQQTTEWRAFSRKGKQWIQI